MAPEQFHSQAAVVNFMLENYDSANACFLAERIHAEVNSEDSLKLLANCFYRNGDYYKAYHLLRENEYTKSAHLKFLLAQCCYQMKKYTEAESVLTSNSIFRKESSLPIDEIIKEFGTSAAFALAMAGDISRLSCKSQKAREYYKKSLSLNPFIWSAYQNLCELGEKLDSETLMSNPVDLQYCLQQPETVKRLLPWPNKTFDVPQDVSTPWVLNRGDAVGPVKLQVPSQFFPKNSSLFSSIKAEPSVAFSNPIMHNNFPSKDAQNKPVDNCNLFATPNSNNGDMVLEEAMDVSSDEQNSSSNKGISGGADLDSYVLSKVDGGGAQRRVTRGLSKLMAAGANHSDADRSVLQYGDTPLTSQGVKYETPEGRDTPELTHLKKAPLKKRSVIKRNAPVPPLHPISNLNHSTDLVNLCTTKHQDEKAALPSSNLSSMGDCAASSSTTCSTNIGTNAISSTNGNNTSPQILNTRIPSTQQPETVMGGGQISTAVASVNKSNQSVDNHLTTSQQANTGCSIHISTSTPVQQVQQQYSSVNNSINSSGSTNGGNNHTSYGLRRSSRLYNGSNQLKENSKSLSKSSLSRRQKIERAPNKSNSITNVLNAHEEKQTQKMSAEEAAAAALAQQAQFSPCGSKDVSINSDCNCNESIQLVSVSTQTNNDNNTSSLQHCANLATIASFDPLTSSSAMQTVMQTEDVCVFSRTHLESLLELYKVLGKAYSFLATKFQCDDAISLLQTLPLNHYETGWVLELIGRAFCEKSDFKQAARTFKQMWDVEPYRVSGLDLYSTALWHLKQSHQLSYLAHQVTEMAKDKPQVWCIVGNCFALQKEHEHAIQFLSRAIQVDPNYYYAYTLLGFEYLEVDVSSKAENCFRNAVRIHDRHYTAWLGLARLYFHQEKYMEAEIHYTKALSIRRNSPIILCYLAVVLHKLSRSYEALERLNEALKIDPKNPLCKYHKAMILYSLNDCKESLKLLEELELQIPNEGLLYFSIGQVYKKLGEPHLELMNFAHAMDLDPKGSSSLIKQAIQKNFLPQDKQGSSVDDPQTIHAIPQSLIQLLDEPEDSFDNLF